MFQTLGHDIRYAFRLIARNPWSSATIVATLTVGIALNVSVFSVLNGLLLRPWVRSQPETFLSISPRFTGEYQLWFSEGGMSQPDYALYRDASRTVESLAAYRFLSLTLSGDVVGHHSRRHWSPAISSTSSGPVRRSSGDISRQTSALRDAIRWWRC